MDYFLKANNEQELMTKLAEVGAVEQYEVRSEVGDEVQVKYRPTQGVNLDIIGTISKPTGDMVKNAEGVEVPVMEQLEGFHANVRGNVNLGETVEYIQYQPTEQELADPEFKMPEPEVKVTPSPIAELLVQPKNPVRVWA